MKARSSRPRRRGSSARWRRARSRRAGSRRRASSSRVGLMFLFALRQRYDSPHASAGSAGAVETPPDTLRAGVAGALAANGARQPAARHGDALCARRPRRRRRSSKSRASGASDTSRCSGGRRPRAGARGSGGPHLAFRNKGRRRGRRPADAGAQPRRPRAPRVQGRREPGAARTRDARRRTDARAGALPGFSIAFLGLSAPSRRPGGLADPPVSKAGRS